MRTDGDQHGVKPLGKDVIQVVHAVVQAQVNAKVNDVLHLTLNNPCWQAIFRHSEP